LRFQGSTENMGKASHRTRTRGGDEITERVGGGGYSKSQTSEQSKVQIETPDVLRKGTSRKNKI